MTDKEREDFKQEARELMKAGIISTIVPEAQAIAFLQTAKEKGLSPLSKEIHITARKNKKTGVINSAVIVGINGFRKIARDAGGYVGSSEPVYDFRGDGTYKTATDLKIEKTFPISCRCTVKRITDGIIGEYTAEVLFDEFAQKYQGQLTGLWKTMPFQMIAKVAESFAIRKAFSDSVTGFFIPEESGAMDSVMGFEIEDKSKAKDESNAKEKVDISKTSNSEDEYKTALRKEIENALKAQSDIEGTLSLYNHYKSKGELTDKPELVSLFTARKKELS